MNKLLYTLCFLLLQAAGYSQSFDERTTTVSRVRLNVTNVGTFGNAFRGYRDGSGNPSGEYPAGSGIEHLFESGIWFGGLVNGQAIVSTSAYDAPRGYSTGGSGFEFTAEEGGAIQERSTLFDSPFFSGNAVSHQDYVSDFTDANVVVPGTNTPINNHINPFGIDVHLETYNWNYSFSDFFVILNYRIINNGSQTIENAHFGLWANTVVRNTNITPAGSGGAAFYAQGGNGFDDSLYLAYCYDATGDVGFTESYVGEKFLGATYKGEFRHPDVDSISKVNYNAWNFNNSSGQPPFPTTDVLRYQMLTTGLNHDPCWTQGPSCSQSQTWQEQLNESGNRSDIIAVGPFDDFQPGDTITLAYAFIFGQKFDDGNPNYVNNELQRSTFYANADWAQTAFNGEDTNFNGILDPGEDRDGDGEITRYILPAPPAIPRTHVETSDNKIEVYWTDNSEASIDPITRIKDFEGYRIYLSKLAFDVGGTPGLDLASELVKAGEFDLPQNGYAFDVGLNGVRLDEPVTFENDTNVYRYKYTFENVLSGWQYAVAVTAFDRGNEASNLESLESSPSANLVRVFPGTNPNNDMESDAPFAYPNPYYSGASWEGASSFQEESRKLIFANLPERCVIRIFSPAGDLIDEIEHNQQYTGNDTRWFRTFGAENAEDNVFSGGEHAWDLLSQDSQIISRGLYLFSVEDLDSGNTFKGKFVIIK